MGLFGNIGGMAAAVMNRRNTNQQPRQGGIGNALRAAQNNMAVMGMGPVVSQNQPQPGGMSGMFASMMRGRNVANQNQLTSTAINPNAFNTGTVGQVFQSNLNPVGIPIMQKKSSPLKQVMDGSVDPLTGQYIDPTLDQGMNPGTVDPMLNQDITSLPQY